MLAEQIRVHKLANVILLNLLLLRTDIGSTAIDEDLVLMAGTLAQIWSAAESC